MRSQIIYQMLWDEPWFSQILNYLRRDNTCAKMLSNTFCQTNWYIFSCEQRCVYIAKHDSNLPQTYTRIRSKVDLAFSDLELLLGAGLPEEKEDQLFSAEKIRKFAEALLKGSRSNVSYTSRYQMLQTRKSEIALILAKIGLEFLTSQYSLLSKRNPSLGQTTINELRHSILICRDISDEIKSRSIESKTQREKTVHIFDWEMVPGRHQHRLQDFLMERLKTLNLYNEHTTDIERFQVTKDENKETLECYLDCSLYWETREGGMVYDTGFDINAIIKIQDENSALLRIDGNAKEIHREELILQKEKNNLHILVKE
jgi:hypothetical protein